jgi:hypothetical protein
MLPYRGKAINNGRALFTTCRAIFFIAHRRRRNMIRNQEKSMQHRCASSAHISLPSAPTSAMEIEL